jgi:hypothetical protein
MAQKSGKADENWISYELFKKKLCSSNWTYSIYIVATDMYNLFNEKLCPMSPAAKLSSSKSNWHCLQPCKWARELFKGYAKHCANKPSSKTRALYLFVWLVSNITHPYLCNDSKGESYLGQCNNNNNEDTGPSLKIYSPFICLQN